MAVVFFLKDYNSRHAAPRGGELLAPTGRSKGLSGAGRGEARLLLGPRAGLTEGEARQRRRPRRRRRMEAVVFVFSLLDCCALIFLSVYFIITLSDLECDYINARSCCSKLNKWVLPELVGHTIVTVLMLISLHWFIFLLNLPVATWNIYRFIMVPSGNMGVFDPTEIHNRGQLKSHMKEAMIKLGFHLLCFFMYLYSMILALIND
uniref:Cornichon family member 4 n=1 Tax=Sus scrofa TaxID=9823 RepID=A0A8D1DBK8_PIG